MSFSMKDIQSMMQRAGFPGRDFYDLPDSTKTFEDGAHYRHEASGISSPQLLETLFRESHKRGVAVHRVIYGMKGSADRNTMSELREIAHIAQEGSIELIMELGINAKYDKGRHIETDGGIRAGVRIRGADQMSYMIANLMRCAEAGIKGFLLRSEGALYLLNQMKTNGDLPSDLIFKMSYDCGCSDPAGAKLLENIGAGSINPVSDLELPMLSAIRSVTDIPMDLVIYGWPALGSLKRHWECPEMIRVAAPIYLKQELWQDPVQQAQNVEILTEIIERSGHDLRVSERAPIDLCIPDCKGTRVSLNR